MAQDSMLWNTTGTGDGPSGGYTQQNWLDFMRYIFTPDSEATAYVFPRKGNKLAVTPGSSLINLDTGAAMGYGFFYKNTASVAVPITTPLLGTTGLIVVLRASWAAQTVRVDVVRNSDGVAGLPAATQTPGTTYEAVLATGTITTGGVVTLTDTRGFIAMATEVIGAMFNANAADASTLEVASNVMRVKDAGITAAKLAAAVAGNGLSGGAGSPLAVNVDAVTIEINADTLRVKDDGIDDLKVGNRVMQAYRRQGGSASNWRTAGTSNHTPTMVRAQFGVIDTGTFGNQTVTFPVAFSDVPIVYASALPGSNPFYANAGSITATTANIASYDPDGNLEANVNVAWLAIGPQ